MNYTPQNKRALIRSGIILFAALCLGGLSFIQNKKDIQVPVACTMEAKICPDGSAVGRIGPSCEFAQCPTDGIPVLDISSWKMVRDTKQHISYAYPETLPSAYVHVQVWPPQPTVSLRSYTCTSGGAEISEQGRVQEKTIGGRPVCVNIASEGAAGSIYTTYTYVFQLGAKIVQLSSVVRTVQCDNYDNPQNTACKKEQAGFDFETILEGVVKSVQGI